MSKFKSFTLDCQIRLPGWSTGIPSPTLDPGYSTCSWQLTSVWYHIFFLSGNPRFERAALQDTVDSLRRQIESLTRWCRPSSLDASLIRFEHLFNDNFSTQGTPKLKHITVLHNAIKAIIQLFIWWWKFWKITIKEDSINGVEVCTLYRLGCPWLFAPAWDLGHLGWERLTSFHSACCGSN